MGCNIHAHIEVKINDKWEHYSCLPIKRCYALFAKIAGVRKHEDWEIEPISEPRGLPEDCNIVTKVYSDEEQGHSPTFLNRKELNDLIEWADKKENINQEWDGQWSHEQLGYFDLHKRSCPPEITDVRFICWFDN